MLLPERSSFKTSSISHQSFQSLFHSSRNLCRNYLLLAPSRRSTREMHRIADLCIMVSDSRVLLPKPIEQLAQIGSPATLVLTSQLR
jgi:hypothetical protein